MGWNERHAFGVAPLCFWVVVAIAQGLMQSTADCVCDEVVVVFSSQPDFLCNNMTACQQGLGTQIFNKGGNEAPETEFAFSCVIHLCIGHYDS